VISNENTAGGSPTAAFIAESSPLLALKVAHRSFEAAQPSSQFTDVVDLPSALQVSKSLLEQVTAPGEQPHRSIGQSGGTIVQTL
jgi:hypothetical protein